MTVDFETILYKEEDNISYVYINMPPANKMIPKFLMEIITVIDKYVIEAQTKAVIVSGTGRHFSSGADIDQLLNFVVSESTYKDYEIVNYPDWYIKCKKAFLSLSDKNVPVISLIKGFCIGSGFELALSSHIRICEKNAQIALPESTFGLLPGVNGTLKMCENIGCVKAFDLIFRGAFINEDEALDIGLIDCVVRKKESLECAKKFVDYIENNDIIYKKENAKKIFSDFCQRIS